MTDKAIEAAAKTLFENTPIVGNRSWQWCCDKLPALAEKWRVCARAAIAAYEQAMWRPIEEAKKDGTPILARIKPSLDREDLKWWQGLYVVIRHPGLSDDGFDIGWNIAAPVGHGGFPDEWFDGFRPLPPPPGKEG